MNRPLPKPEKPKDEQHDHDGADDPNNLMRELTLFCVDGSGAGLREPVDSPTTVRAAGWHVGSAPHKSGDGLCSVANRQGDGSAVASI